MGWSNVLNLIGPTGVAGYSTLPVDIPVNSLTASTINTNNLDFKLNENSTISVKFTSTLMENLSTLALGQLTDISLSNLNFTKRPIITTQSWLAVTSGGILRSPDGSNWTLIQSNYIYNGIAYGSSMWLAVLNPVDNNITLTNPPGILSNFIQYSSNGYNWYPGNYGGFTDCQGVAYGSNIWIVVGAIFQGTPNVSTIQYSSDGSNWYPASSGGFATGHDVAYGSNNWMAVGESDSTQSSIQYSTDGSNWSNANFGGFFTGNGVAYGSNMWVAVGDVYDALSTIQWSTDTSNWSNAATGGFSIGKGVAYGSNMWVAVGSADSPQSTIQWSTNGSDWYAANTGGFINYPGGGICIGDKVSYKSGMWIAGGNAESSSNSIQYSTDGSNWSNTNTSFENIDNGNMKDQFEINNYDAAYGNIIIPLLYDWNIRLIDDVLTVNNSVTSVNFTEGLMTNLSTLALDSLYLSNISTSSLLVNTVNNIEFNYGLMTNLGTLASNTLSITDIITSNLTVFNLNNVVFTNNLTNNLNTLNENKISLSNIHLKPIVPRWVAVGNTIKYSPDGSNWETTGFSVFSPANGIAYGSNTWVAVGVPYAASNAAASNRPLETIKYSTDTYNWYNAATGGFTRNNGISYGGNGIAYGSNMWVAVGNTDSPQSSIQYSTNASNWSSVNTGGFILEGTNTGNDVAYGSNMWVAVGKHNNSNATIQYSTDGSNWSNANYGGFNYGNGIAYGSDIYGSNIWVAVGRNTNPLGSIKWSTDGSNWSNVTLGGFNLTSGALHIGNGVAYGSNMWVAVGKADTPQLSIQYSIDGRNWYAADSGGFDADSCSGFGVKWGGGLWVAVGAGSDSSKTIQYSSNGFDWYDANYGGFEGYFSGNYGNSVAYRTGYVPYDWNISLNEDVLNVNNSVTSVNFTQGLMSNLNTLGDGHIDSLSVMTLEVSTLTFCGMTLNMTSALFSTLIGMS